MSEMVVYAAADLHGRLLDVPEDADLLILGGDICPDFPPRGVGMVDTGGAHQAWWLDTEFRAWLRGHRVPTIAIWGNHDFVGQHPHLLPDLPLVLLQDSGKSVLLPGDDAPISIYGTPWVPGLPRWAFHGTEELLRARAEAIPECDVLVSHGPPYGYGDSVPTSEKQRTKYGNHEGIRVGDPALTEAIERVKPKIVVCGHIHEGRGIYQMGETTIYNVAAVNERYVPHDYPWTRLHGL